MYAHTHTRTTTRTLDTRKTTTILTIWSLYERDTHTERSQLPIFAFDFDCVPWALVSPIRLLSSQTGHATTLTHFSTLPAPSHCLWFYRSSWNEMMWASTPSPTMLNDVTLDTNNQHEKAREKCRRYANQVRRNNLRTVRKLFKPKI